MIQHEPGVQKQQRAQRQNKEAGELHDFIQGVHQVGMHFFILFGIQGDLGSIIIAADMFHPGQAPAADHKAAGQQQIARLAVHLCNKCV